jgi:oxygen-independent coproporphyrinogen-3 oxidase
MSREDVPGMEYARAIEAELNAQVDKYGLRGRRVGSIYLGGGTPTILSTDELGSILDTVRGHFSVTSGAEITIEANPETLFFTPNQPSSSRPTAKTVIPTEPVPAGSKPGVGIQNVLEPLDSGFRRNDKNIGPIPSLFSRISIGCQSFNDAHLKKLGRIHSAGTAIRAVKAMQDAGCKNIGIDLMWGLPGQTLAELERDLDIALGLGVQHISAYQLTLESKNVAERFSVPSTDGALKGSSTSHEDVARKMFLLVHNTLTSGGFEHYEISNFAKKGFRSRHNENYWHYGEWLGLGCGATSFFKSPPPSGEGQGEGALTRFSSLPSITDYLAHRFAYNKEVIPARTAMGEYCFLALRTSDGIDLEDFRRRFGTEFDLVYPGLREKWINRGLAVAPLSLTLNGWLISNELFSDLVLL